MVYVIDWVLAFLPVAAVLILMLRFQWGGARAGAIGWTVALIVAAVRFGAGARLLGYAQLKGLLLTLFVLYIIWGALLFYRTTEQAGAVEAIGKGLPRLTPDRGIQALLIGWVFSTFLQGVGGFGVPVAVTAPLLVGLGFPPLAAIVIPSIGHPWAVTFGSLGSSFFALMASTGRSGASLAPWSATFLGLACLGCGAGALWAAGGGQALRAGFGTLFVVGLPMAITQYIVVTNGLWSIGAMTAGLAGLVVGVAWARWRGRHQSGQNERSAADSEPTMPLGWALSPYALLITIVLLAQLVEPVHDFLSHLVLRVRFPKLSTARGWSVPAEAGRSINVFGHPGALLAYASAITYALFFWRRYYEPGAAGRIGRGVVNRAVRSSIGTAAMVGMAVTMQHAGMTHQLADGIARLAGPAFPLAAPFIGALGAFMTGSNTNSNVIFGDLQQTVATLVGVSPLVILAGQTAGAAIGSAFAPAKVIVGCSTVDAEEGPALQGVMRYGIAIVAVLALATGAAATLFG
ncbi:MAG: L-lactate permease [Anaerolineae bacterium]|jgi:lactate permease